ncbi:DUF4426 domain-containing protein [Thioalkalivibrio sulfidiphilus]|uniref:DUF4426 domain-containing protein n=1 Tax=Thioalkalivibrio sulfidiphilus (strain HL-EbGR7) TaxID=396588 RepID=B8GP75_THISH|nr:DUF4426 domain-containing protein [Thioalkalivibrio sulfidiphilus]ACL73995.1 conserved hypothetical protein [Thioalkalivibrio sulfidiphilus HL-EbGr7]
MKRRHVFKAFLLLVMAGALSGTVHAGGQQDFGDYVVHFNALSTDFLSPDVARSYNITRSRNRALINISIMKKSLGVGTEPQLAVVTGKAVNLRGQTLPLQFREVRDSTAIYYLAEVGIDDGETLDFMIEATPRDSGPLTVRFRQQFFTR